MIHFGSWRIAFDRRRYREFPGKGTLKMTMNRQIRTKIAHRRYFIGGSDARTIMGDDEAALLRLWREKRGEIEPEDLSGNLTVQLGLATEDLNRRWYQANTVQVLTRCAASDSASGAALDGGDPGRPGRSDRRGL